jgi:hypothetical protein
MAGMLGCPRRRPKAGERKGVNGGRAVIGHSEKDLNMQSRVTNGAARHNVEGYPLTDFHQS